MTEVLEQLSQTCHLVNHLWNDLCPFQRWLRGWCWEEWHTSLKTAVNICLRWVQCKHRKHMTPAHFSKMSLLISSCFYPLYSPPGFLPHHRYLSLLILFPLLLQASWSDGFVSSVVRTQQDVTELLSQVRTSTETHWLIITLSEYTHQVIRN